jgi:type IV pilus assembly protein PilM
LNRTVVFYNSSHAEKPLNETVPLFVGGEIAEHEDAWPQLVGRLRFDVSLLPNPLQAPDTFPANDFAVNVGLALKELTNERPGNNFSTINLNVLPPTYQPKRIPIAWVVSPALGVLAIGVIGYVAMMSFRAAGEVEDLRDVSTQSAPSIAQQTQNIASLKSQLGEVTPLSAPIDTQAAQVRATAAIYTATMSDLNAGRTKVNEDLKVKVVGLLPANKINLGLTSVNHDGSAVTVTGTAADEDFVFTYARQLRESGGVSNVLVTSIQAVPDEATNTNRYEFNIVVR